MEQCPHYINDEHQDWEVVVTEHVLLVNIPAQEGEQAVGRGLEVVRAGGWRWCVRACAVRHVRAVSCSVCALRVRTLCAMRGAAWTCVRTCAWVCVRACELTQYT